MGVKFEEEKTCYVDPRISEPIKNIEVIKVKNIGLFQLKLIENLNPSFSYF